MESRSSILRDRALLGLEQFDFVTDFSDHRYRGKVKLTNKVTIERIMKEWKILIKSLPESIFVRVYENRVDLMRAAIMGAQGTPYHHGLFFFDISFPSNYPNSPPKVHYHSFGLRLNPNLYESGHVCLSLLNTWPSKPSMRWNPSSTILQVLVSLQGLVLNEKPVYNEPVVSFRYKTWEGYNEDAFVLSCKTMLFLLQKPPKNFEALIVGHFRQNAVMILRACVAYKEDRVRIGFFNGDDDYDAPVSKKVSIRSFFFGQYQVSGRFKESIYKIYPKLFNAFSAIAAPNLQSMPEELETQMPEMPENSGVLKRIFCFSIFISAILVCFVAIYISYAGC